ncbi:unnamed protein product, partial [Pylaiella littoralis]
HGCVLYASSPGSSSSSKERAAKMVGTTRGDFYAAKDILRAMIRAWNDLPKEKTNEWTAQLKEEAARQQNLSEPAQVTTIIREVLFH